MAGEQKLLKLMYLTELLSSSESSSDEEMMYTAATMFPKKSKIKKFLEVIQNYTDCEFKENFRLERKTCAMLIEKFKESDYFPKNEGRGGMNVISAEIHILSFLWFAGNKTVIREVVQLFNVSFSTFYIICDRVMDYLLSIASEVIKLPTNENEMENLSTNFEAISGFPNVIGCIDGTYINIRTPEGKIKSTYVNRHHQTALTLQGVCDSKKRFLDAFTGVSSKIHDSRVFKQSFISTTIPAICGNTYHLLGDSAYPLAPYLLTPYRDYGNLTHRQRIFNRKLSTTRVLIENTFGLLKSRFRQLLYLEFYTVLKSSRFIMSCCILHNICINNNDTWEQPIINLEENEPAYINQRRDLTLRLGEEKRTRICNML